VGLESMRTRKTATRIACTVLSVPQVRIEYPAGDMHGLSQVVSCSLPAEAGPEKVQDTLAVEDASFPCLGSKCCAVRPSLVTLRVSF
jgi:hypothetical protein